MNEESKTVADQFVEAVTSVYKSVQSCPGTIKVSYHCRSCKAINEVELLDIRERQVRHVLCTCGEVNRITRNEFPSQDKPGPSYAPAYAAMYSELAELAKDHGYALAIHGSLRRDFDLVAIPWAETVSTPLELIDAMTSTFALNLLNREPTKKNHGRLAWTLSIGWGHCAIDLSFVLGNDKSVTANDLNATSSC